MIQNKNSKQSDFLAEYQKLLEETVIPRLDEFDAKIKPIKDLVSQNLPTLYRFRSCSKNSIDAFLNNYVYHSEPQFFNDPHDCLIYLNQDLLTTESLSVLLTPELEKKMERIFDALEHWAEDSESIYYPYHKSIKEMQAKRKYNLHDKIRKSYYYSQERLSFCPEQITRLIAKLYGHFRSYPRIACFSEDVDSTLMWAHYADFHKGFALEYDSASLKDLNLYPVVYRAERYDVTDLAHFCFTNELMVSTGAPNSTEIPDNFVYTKANLYKGENWKYEKEWRSIISNRSLDAKKDVKPKAIYLGVEISQENEKLLIKHAEEKGIEIYRMWPSLYSKEFKFIKQKVSKQ